MKILVTGGAGFIASHIVDKYIEKNYEVVVVDNLSSGKRENVNANAKFYLGDITDANFLDSVFSKEKPDIVNHHAAQAVVPFSVKYPEKDIQVNIIGTLNILESAKKHEVKKVIYSNSGGAGYGNPQYLHLDESHPINPISPYGIDKHTAEHYLQLYNNLYKIKFVSLRYANVYGPRQDPSGEAGVVSIFTNKLLKNEQPFIFGDGSQTRDYVYVKDVVSANLLATESSVLDNKCFNIGTGIQTSTQQIFNMLKEISSSQLSPIYQSERPGDAKASCLNIEKIKSFGWNPEYTLEQGLKETVDYFKSIISKTNLRNATLAIPIQGDKILLGMKKKGFGIGKLNGFGGKQQENEHIDDTAIRELEEEIGLKTTRQGIRKMAEIDFFFPHREDRSWDQTVHIYLVDSWTCNPVESDEMSFEWHSVNNIPFARMWNDDFYWLPLILKGKRLKATFNFAADNNSIETKQITEL